MTWAEANPEVADRAKAALSYLEKSEEASHINNEGLDVQAEYLESKGWDAKAIIEILKGER